MMKYKKLIYGTLLASLALNLFFAGMVTVFLFKGAPGKPFGPADRFNLEAAREVLEPEYRNIIDEIWVNFRTERQGEFRSIFMLRREMQDILEADEFDNEAFEKVFSTMQEIGMESRLALIEVLREITEALPPEQRKKYFQTGMAHQNRGEFPRPEQRRRPPPPEE